MSTLLQELTLDIDPNDIQAVNSIKQTLARAKSNPQRANREATLAAKGELKSAQSAEQSPTKTLDVKIAKMKQQLSLLQQQRNQLIKRTESHCIVTDDNGKMVFEGILNESAIQAYKRTGNVVKRQFRCTSGKKDGIIVASPNDCNKRKNPKSVRAGKKASKSKKSVRINKSRITKNTSLSKMVSRMNAR